MDGGVDSIREVLSGDTVYLDKLDDETGIFDQVDAFVNLTRDNKSVEEVTLWIPVTDPGHDVSGTYRYAIWVKIAEDIENLMALREITIVNTYCDDEEDPLAFD